MKLATLAFVAILAAVCSDRTLAQSDQVHLPLKVNVGDTFTIRVSSTMRQTKGESTISDVSLEQTQALRVIERTSQGYVFENTLKSFRDGVSVDGGPRAQIQAEAGRAILEAFKDQPSVIETDGAGIPTRVRNWPALSNKLADILRRTLTPAITKLLLANAQGKDPGQVETIVQSQVEAVVRTAVLRHDERSAAQLNVIQFLIGGVQNRSWRVGQTVEADGRVSSLVSDGQIPIATRATLQSYNTARNEAVVVWRADYDGEELRKAALELVTTQARAAGLGSDKVDEASKLMSQLTVTREDEGEAKLTIKTGWVKRLEFTKKITSSMPGQPADTRHDKMVIEILPLGRK